MSVEQRRTGGVRVPVVEEAQAEGRTAELYARLKEMMGVPFVPDLFTLLGTKPDLLQATVFGVATLGAEGALSRRLKELIAAWTARLNQCEYCVGTHNYFLRRFGGSADLAEAVAASSSVDDLPVDERERALLALVSKVTTAATRIGDADWEGARAAGWSEEELLEAVFTAALFNFVVRLVDSFGLSTAMTRSKVSGLPASAPGNG
ncbi:carboxymuconolactone decarboxylase family protein [Amycolatopsis sp. NPDC059090]|uniref:carboxymuconolactone decarboxylase family protein n=1 Tax=unclassified Amycolatopsis TaxID=2618356 RepID=UPI00367268F5